MLLCSRRKHAVKFLVVDTTTQKYWMPAVLYWAQAIGLNNNVYISLKLINHLSFPNGQEPRVTPLAKCQKSCCARGSMKRNHNNPMISVCRNDLEFKYTRFVQVILIQFVKLSHIYVNYDINLIYWCSYSFISAQENFFYQVKAPFFSLVMYSICPVF